MIRMEASFRASMSWLHTWFGVGLGAVLFSVFWTGTLSVFDREIDRWMAPMTRLALPSPQVPLDRLRELQESAIAAKAQTWFVALPSEREPIFRIAWRDSSRDVVLLAHPETVDLLPDPGTRGASGFLYPFHYNLHIHLAGLGYWLVGAAGMAMLGLCVSGVVVHRKLFASFFTLRAEGNPRRFVLDLHNVTGVLAMPFAVVICLSGLVIHWFVYFPSTKEVAYQKDLAAFRREVFGIFDRPASGHPATMMSLDAMADRARRLWAGDGPSYLLVHHPGDSAAFVQMGRAAHASVGGAADVATLDAVTGMPLHLRATGKPIISTQLFVAGLHLMQFRNWTLRWLYFGLGLTSCATIATGYLFWIQSRRKRPAQAGLTGVRTVEAVTVGMVTGIVIATLAFFVANRLLPSGSVVGGHERATLEIRFFFAAWLGAFLHAVLRPRHAWIEQCWTISALAAAAMVLNWITTGDHIARTLSLRHLWPVAGMDLMLGSGALLAAFAALALQRRAVAL